MKHNTQQWLCMTAVGFILAAMYPLQGAEESVRPLADISSAVKRKNGEIEAAELDNTASRFSTLVAQADFSPSVYATQDIRQATQVAEAILLSLDARMSRQPAFTAIDTYLSKLTAAIDSTWKHIPVYANVGPPSGVTNAASGMNPDAITDPKLKQQYLERIAANQRNNQKNSQQIELRRSRDRILWIISSLTTKDGDQGLQKTDVLSRFGKDQDCKTILEEHFKRSGK